MKLAWRNICTTLFLLIFFAISISSSQAQTVQQLQKGKGTSGIAGGNVLSPTPAKNKKDPFAEYQNRRANNCLAARAALRETIDNRAPCLESDRLSEQAGERSSDAWAVSDIAWDGPNQACNDYIRQRANTLRDQASDLRDQSSDLRDQCWNNGGSLETKWAYEAAAEHACELCDYHVVELGEGILNKCDRYRFEESAEAGRLSN